jgi:hypothetical protein
VPSQTAQQIQWAKPAIRALGDKLGFFRFGGALPHAVHGRKDDLSACRGQQQKNEALHYLADHPLSEDERALKRTSWHAPTDSLDVAWAFQFGPPQSAHTNGQVI